MEIPSSVTSIGYAVFSGCSSLTNVISLIPAENLFAIDHSIFNNVNKKTCTLCVPRGAKDSYTSTNGWSEFTYVVELICGDNLTWKLADGVLTISGNGDMYDYTFHASIWYRFAKEITSVVIEDGVTSIGNNAFSICSSLVSIPIPKSVTSIGERAFSKCSSLASITIPKSVTSIGYAAFAECSSLESIAIPESVTSIADAAFWNCSSLTSVTIGNGVTSIGNYAFSDCSSLASVTIGNGVTSIGNYAFSDCSSLASITSLIPAENLYAISSDVFEYVDKSACTLYVPVGAKETYAATSGWSEFTNIEELQYSLTVGSAGYATLYLDYPVRLSEHVKAYYVNRVDDNCAMLERIWDYIPATTGVIIQAEPGTYSFEYSAYNVSSALSNMLSGTVVDSEICVAANTEYYVLGRSNGVVGFYRATTPGGIYFNNANKAYLPLTVAEQSARVSLLFPDGTTTDVNEVFGAEGEDVIYDIYGNRIEEITEHGVYIINGKKVIR